MSRLAKWIVWVLVGLIGTAGLIYLLGPVLFASVAYPLPPQYQESLCKWSAEYDVDVHLEAAKIMVESTWNPNARSAYAYGLTQFIPSTAKRVYTTVYGPEKGAKFTANQLITNPDLAIQLGTFHLRELIDSYHGDLTKVLIAYNGGGGAARLYELGTPIPSTVAYARKILSIRDAYNKIYGDFCAKNAATGEFNIEPKKDASVITAVPLNEFWKNFIFTRNVSDNPGSSSSSPFEGLWQNLTR